MNKFSLIVVIISLLSACTNQPQKTPDLLSEPEIRAQLTDAVVLIKQGNFKRAIDGPLSKANSACDKLYSDSGKQVYVARNLAETILLLAMSAAADDKKDAQVIDTICPDVFYMTGYAYVDLGKIDEAIPNVNKAIAMSPLNSQYLSELGHLYQVQRKHEESLKIFQESEAAADKWSPESVKKDELARAKRGVGFNLIELNRLDEAEAKFKECLELNPDDKGASNELAYIRSLRSQTPVK
jgi:tetratricopeptide (TPR) repeat protein